MLGDKLIVIIPPADRSQGYIEPGSRLTGAGPTGLEALQNNAEIVGRDVVRLLKEAEATLAKVDAAVTDIQSAAKQLGEAVGKINRTVLADKNLAHLDTTLENLATHHRAMERPRARSWIRCWKKPAKPSRRSETRRPARKKP